MDDSLACVILGGGRGTRLRPLTLVRAKPAVPFAGRYRLVDIPLSNCLQARFFNIYVLTQFNSAPLHLHVHNTYRFDEFNNGRIELLPARQQFNSALNEDYWYHGSADAVRKNFDYISGRGCANFLIMSGDQLCDIDLQEMFNQHQQSDADFTIATVPIDRKRARNYGLLRFADSPSKKIVDFVEKPSEDQLLPFLFHDATTGAERCWGSMGIYIIKTEVLRQLLNNGLSDFGRDVIPLSMDRYRILGFEYRGFFEDIGTIETFYYANIQLGQQNLGFDLYTTHRIYGAARQNFPPARIFNARISSSLVAGGSSISDNCVLENTVIGLGVNVNHDTRLEGVYHMGVEDCHTFRPSLSRPGFVGSDCHLRRCIIDTNAYIGNGCRIGLAADYPDTQTKDYTIRSGIVIVHQGVSLPDNTII